MPLWRRHGTPLQYSRLENPMDGGAWWAAVHGVAKSQIRLSDFTFTFQFHALEKEKAIHSCVFAWRTPGTEEPGGLPSMGSHRVGHDWSSLAAAACPFSPPVSSRVALTDSSPHTDGFLPPPSQPLCLATHRVFSSAYKVCSITVLGTWCPQDHTGDKVPPSPLLGRQS